MTSGFGLSVIAWSQVEVDGAWAPPLAALRPGASFLWVGEALSLAGVPGLPETARDAETRRRAVRAVGRLLERAGVAVAPAPADPADGPINGPPDDRGLTVTDGRRAWTLALIEPGGGRRPLLLASGPLPPRQTELWVVGPGPEPDAPTSAPAGGVICFTPGTSLLTPWGAAPVETLREGDRVQTKDGGAAEILWMARRRLSGARLYAMPHLAPVRLRAGALDRGVPDAGLLVSPDHRLLLRGARARALFGQDEVLVAARALVDDRRVHVERGLREVTYIHLLLPEHGIVFANGVETESFHPASAALASLAEDDRARLLERLPEAADPEGYGPFARRVLSPSEAAILCHDLA